MTTHTSVAALSDAELIARVRSGDTDAYGLLFERHHGAAMRLAKQLTSRGDADDLVAEAFAKVLPLLRAGGGPDLAFRAYLLTAVRRLHVDRIRATRRLHTTDDMESFDSGVPFTDPAVADFERNATAKAFASLPERWQMVLWHCEVEGSKPADVAPLLGMSPNSVAALAYRAREGLRQAYLRNHLADIADKDCRWTTERLGGFVRRGLSRRDHARVEQHIAECRRCAALYLELSEVNENLRGLLAPWLLGAAASGYFATCGAAVPTSLSWWTRASQVTHVGGTHVGVVAAAGVTISAVVGAAIFVQGSPPAQSTLDQAISRPLTVVDPVRDLHQQQVNVRKSQELAPSRTQRAEAPQRSKHPVAATGLGAGRGEGSQGPSGRGEAGGGTPGDGGGTTPGPGGGTPGTPGGGGSTTPGDGGGTPGTGGGTPGTPGDGGGTPGTGGGTTPGTPGDGGSGGHGHGPGHTPGTDPQPEHGNDDEHGHGASKPPKPPKPSDHPGHTPGTDPQPDHGNDGEHGHHGHDPGRGPDAVGRS